MAYLAFLSLFIGVPALLLALLNALLHGRGALLPSSLRAWPATPVVGAHVLLALLYTSPWDNYLVATGVWWYNPELILGITFGYVPLEEYLFFAAQTVLLGLAFAAAARLTPPPEISFRSYPWLRLGSAGSAMAIWLYALFLLGSGNPRSTYLGLELAWGIVPLSIQLIFGADILWYYRRPVLWTLLPGTLFLSAADSIAIFSGTWTIDPQQSLGIVLGGILPLEELVFFLLTAAMVVFGVTLVCAKQSHLRARWLPSKLRRVE